jgi:hypothetical protein
VGDPCHAYGLTENLGYYDFGLVCITKKKCRRRADAGLQLAERALVVAEGLGYRHLGGLSRRLIGESLIETDPTKAAQYLDEASTVLAGVQARNDLAKTYVLQARLQKARARPLLCEALRLFVALGTTDEVESTEALLAEVAVD